MKKKVINLMMGLCVVAASGFAGCGVKDETKVGTSKSISATSDGLVTITGFAATQLKQYHPQGYTGQDLLITLSPVSASGNSATFRLDSQALSRNQKAFNFLDKDGNWLIFSVPDNNISVGQNVTSVMENGGATFYFSPTVETGKFISATSDGLVTITGFAATQLKQYHPQGYTGQDLLITLSPVSASGNSATFRLDSQALSRNQKAFNFLDKDGNWLIFSVPDNNISVDQNVTSVMENSDATFYFSPTVGTSKYISATSDGLVSITGFAATQLKQYHPQGYTGQDLLITLSPVSASGNSTTFRLDSQAVSRNQKAFNFLDKDGNWLIFSVPDSNISVGQNVTPVVETGGATFYFPN